MAALIAWGAPWIGLLDRPAAALVKPVGLVLPVAVVGEFAEAEVTPLGPEEE